MLDSLAVQEVRWDKGSTEKVGEYTLSMASGMIIVN
jgi:hypothetical protein